MSMSGTNVTDTRMHQRTSPPGDERLHALSRNGPTEPAAAFGAVTHGEGANSKPSPAGANVPPFAADAQLAETNKEYDKMLERLRIETKIKLGAETMLKVYDKQKVDPNARREVENQLEVANNNITELNRQIKEMQTRDRESVRRARQNVGSDVAPVHITASQPSPSGPPDASKTPVTATMVDFSVALHDFLQRVSTPSNSTPNSAHGQSVSSLSEMGLNAAERLQALLSCMSEFALALGSSKTIPPGYIRLIVRSVRDHIIRHSTKEVRANGFRLLRLLAKDMPALETITMIGMQIFIVRALCKEQKFDVERIQALKLARAYIEIDGGVQLLVDGVIRAIVAVAEHADDKLRSICLESLCELAIRDVQRLVRCGGLRTLVQALTEGPTELVDSIISTFQYILDREEQRKFVKSGMDLEMIVSVFTDASTKGAANDERISRSAKVITALLRSWTGIIYLCADGKHTVRSMVESLRLPYEESRKLLLGMFFTIFRLEVPTWLPCLSSIQRRSVRSYSGAEGFFAEHRAMGPARFSDRLNMIDHHLGLLIIVFVEAGVLDALSHLLEDDNKYITIRATILLGEILQLSNRLLPASYSIRMQGLPRLFKNATCADDEHVRYIATRALAQIDNVQREIEMSLIPPQGVKEASVGNVKENSGGHKHLRHRQVQQVKLRMGITIDDAHFRDLLTETNVLATKDYTKWGFDTITELLQGPLLNPRRLEEAIRGTKFVKRLLSFFRPSKRLFCDIKMGKGNMQFVNLGCTLLTTLIACTEGSRYLSDNQLLPEISQCLAQLEPMSGSSTGDLLFSKERMDTTLTCGYFTLLGTLSKYKEGIKILEKFRIFNTYYHLSELRSRDEVVKSIITNMDYSIDGHSRIILSKVLTSGYKHIRLYATSHVRVLLRASVSQFHVWGIRILITQLCDPAIEVCDLAVSILDEACNRKENLDALVHHRLSLDHLGPTGSPLLLRCLSTPQGFQYLARVGYVENEMAEWFQTRNREYVTRLELSLSRVLYFERPTEEPSALWSPKDIAADLNQPKDDDGITPPHFYGELSKTSAGCSLLRKTEHFRHFARYIREHAHESVDRSVLRELKSVLWAVGNIGTSTMGLPFLKEEGIIKVIVELAENSQVFSLRGTCYCVLGLIAKTVEGADLLESYGWVTAETGCGPSDGLCVPLEKARFLSMSGSRNQRPRSVADFADTVFRPEKFDLGTREVIKSIGNLSNHILAAAASKTLVRTRHENPKLFQQPSLFFETLRMFGAFHFRLPVRRFVFDQLEEFKFDEAAIRELDAQMAGWSPAASFDLVPQTNSTVGVLEDGPASREWKGQTSYTKAGEPVNSQAVSRYPGVIVRGFNVRSSRRFLDPGPTS